MGSLVGYGVQLRVTVIEIVELAALNSSLSAPDEAPLQDLDALYKRVVHDDPSDDRGTIFTLGGVVRRQR